MNTAAAFRAVPSQLLAGRQIFTQRSLSAAKRHPPAHIPYAVLEEAKDTDDSIESAVDVADDPESTEAAPQQEYATHRYTDENIFVSLETVDEVTQLYEEKKEELQVNDLVDMFHQLGRVGRGKNKIDRELMDTVAMAIKEELYLMRPFHVSRLLMSFCNLRYKNDDILQMIVSRLCKEMPVEQRNEEWKRYYLDNYNPTSFSLVCFSLSMLKWSGSTVFSILADCTIRRLQQQGLGAFDIMAQSRILKAFAQGPNVNKSKLIGKMVAEEIQKGGRFGEYSENTQLAQMAYYISELYPSDELFPSALADWILDNKYMDTLNLKSLTDLLFAFKNFNYMTEDLSDALEARYESQELLTGVYPLQLYQCCNTLANFQVQDPVGPWIKICNRLMAENGDTLDGLSLPMCCRLLNSLVLVADQVPKEHLEKLVDRVEATSASDNRASATIASLLVKLENRMGSHEDLQKRLKAVIQGMESGIASQRGSLYEMVQALKTFADKKDYRNPMIVEIFGSIKTTFLDQAAMSKQYDSLPYCLSQIMNMMHIFRHQDEEIKNLIQQQAQKESYLRRLEAHQSAQLVYNLGRIKIRDEVILQQLEDKLMKTPLIFKMSPQQLCLCFNGFATQKYGSRAFYRRLCDRMMEELVLKEIADRSVCISLILTGLKAMPLEAQHLEFFVQELSVMLVAPNKIQNWRPAQLMSILIVWQRYNFSVTNTISYVYSEVQHREDLFFFDSESCAELMKSLNQLSLRPNTRVLDVLVKAIINLYNNPRAKKSGYDSMEILRSISQFRLDQPELYDAVLMGVRNDLDRLGKGAMVRLMEPLRYIQSRMDEDLKQRITDRTFEVLDNPNLTFVDSIHMLTGITYLDSSELMQKCVTKCKQLSAGGDNQYLKSRSLFDGLLSYSQTKDPDMELLQSMVTMMEDEARIGYVKIPSRSKDASRLRLAVQNLGLKSPKLSEALAA